MSTEIDDKFEQLINEMLINDQRLSDLLTSEIVEASHLLDAELQRRAGVDINDSRDDLMTSWARYEDYLDEYSCLD